MPIGTRGICVFLAATFSLNRLLRCRAAWASTVFTTTATGTFARRTIAIRAQPINTTALRTFAVLTTTARRNRRVVGFNGKCRNRQKGGDRNDGQRGTYF